jgi:hypothetical protein
VTGTHPPFNMDTVRAASGCATLARLVGYLDTPDIERPDVVEAIGLHLVAHPTCPGNGHATTDASTRTETCRVTGMGGTVKCRLPAGHDGMHESRVLLWG